MVIGAVSAALLVPAVATGAVFHYQSDTASPSPVVAFDYIKKKDGTRKVKRFMVQNIPWSCTNATSGYTPWPVQFPEPMKVRRSDRKFSGVAAYGWSNGDPNTPMGNHYEAWGVLERGGTASGQFRFRFSYEQNNATVQCESGYHNWTAQRVD